LDRGGATPWDEAATVELAQALVRIDTTNPPGNEERMAEYLAQQAQGWGLAARLLPVAPGRANLLIRLPGAGQAPTLIYSGHLDTVPVGQQAWSHDPFAGEVSQGRLWGRGAADMKGGVAAMLSAMAALRRDQIRLPGDLIFLGTIDEEIGFLGSHRLLDDGFLDGAGWLVIAEPTNLDLVPAHRGVLWLEIETLGRAAHGSMPHLGVNAVLHMNALIDRLTRLPLPAPAHRLLPPPTLSVNRVSGGDRINVVPDHCLAWVDLRTVPGQDHAALLAELDQVVVSLAASLPEFRCNLRVLADRPAVETAADHPLMQSARAVARGVLGREPAMRGVSYCTDASVFQPPEKVPTLIFGPGDDNLAHQRDEHVEIAALVAAGRFFTALPQEIFARQPVPAQ
jgi:succinyl-diaminopimelate desuccinylase